MRGESALSASDVALLSGNNGRSNDGMFGDNGAWWIVLFLIFGWGNNGFGGFGGGNSGNGGLLNVERKLDGITQGICDSTYALNNSITNGFSNVQQSLCQGFNGVNTAVLQSANSTERGFCNLQSQIADCCCQTQSAIQGVNYNMAMNTNALQQAMCNNTRDIVENNNNNTRAILDFLTQDKISTLTAENQALKSQVNTTAQNALLIANNEAQTAELIRRIAPTPTPSYVVPNPNCCYNYSVQGVGYNNACNCGSY